MSTDFIVVAKEHGRRNISSEIYKSRPARLPKSANPVRTCTGIERIGYLKVLSIKLLSFRDHSSLICGQQEEGRRERSMKDDEERDRGERGTGKRWEGGRIVLL